MKSIFVSFSLYLICLFEGIYHMCVSFSIILFHLSLSLSTFTLRKRNGLSPLYLSLFIAFLLGAWPILGLLDSSLGYPQNYSVSYEKKGFIYF